MQNEPNNLMLKLWRDQWRNEPMPADRLIELARILDAEFSQAEVRVALSYTPLQPDSLGQLRHLLFVLRRSQMVNRRLTLWERITGRLSR